MSAGLRHRHFPGGLFRWPRPRAADLQLGDWPKLTGE